MNRLLGIMAMIVSSTSLAVVADQFRCELEVRDMKTGEHTKSQQEFYASRILTGITPDRTIQITTANSSSNLELNTKKARINANLSIRYNHAVKFDYQNRPLQAKQDSCILMSGSYCNRSLPGEKEGVCVTAEFACMGTEPRTGPFDPKSSWSPVPLVDGIPQFSSESLNGRIHLISDETGTASAIAAVNCVHLGTLK